jgi:hypothetical protein
MADNGTVVELRVHGVSGTPPEAPLSRPVEFLEALTLRSGRDVSADLRPFGVLDQGRISGSNGTGEEGDSGGNRDGHQRGATAEREGAVKFSRSTA